MENKFSESKFTERFKAVVDHIGMAYSRLDIALGWGNGMVGKVASGKSSITVHSIENLFSKFPEINPEWLLTGVGSMVRARNKTLGVPLVGNVVAWAGNGGGSDKDEYVSGYIDAPAYRNCDVAISVEGASMEPVLKSGDIVLVSLTTSFVDLLWGKIHLVVTSESCQVKYLFPGNCPDCLRMVSANPVFQEQVVKHQDVLKIYQVKGKITEV